MTKTATPSATSELINRMKAEIAIARKVLRAIAPLSPQSRYNLLVRLADETQYQPEGHSLDVTEEVGGND